MTRRGACQVPARYRTSPKQRTPCAAQRMGFHGRVHPPRGQILDAAVLCQADEIAHVVAFAPGQNPPPAEARVAAQDDAHVRPGRAQPFDQQFEDGASVFGGIDVGRPQVGHQQLLAAEDVQRQEAVVIVVAVEEAALLLAMHRIVGRIEVQDEFARGHRERGDESVEDDTVYGRRHLTISALFHPAQRRTGCTGVTLPSAVCSARSWRSRSWSLSSS